MKPKSFLALGLLITQLTFAQWAEVGTIVTGEAPLAFFGEATALSGDGNYMAVGQPSRGTASNADLPGPIVIYKRDGESWNEVHSIESPVNPDENFGASMDFNFDGSRLVFGAPVLAFNIVQNIGRAFVYERQSDDSYTQLGADIVNPGEGSFFGSDVSISSDGLTIAVSRPFLVANALDEGLVYTFRYDGNAWVQFGQVLGGNTANDLFFGTSINMDEDGSILAVGIQRGTIDFGGAMEIYEYDETQDTWSQLGNRVTGNPGLFLGSDIDVTPDGNTIIVGASANIDAGPNTYVEIYERNEDAFVLKGNRIESELGFSGYGQSVSITADGNTIAFGSSLIGPNDSIDEEGGIKIYEFSNGVWTLVSEFFGEILFEALGSTINMSLDGSVIVSGGPSYDPTDNNDAFGGVRTYLNNNILSVESNTFTAQVSIFPNPVWDLLTIKLPENQGQVTVNMFDTLGRRVITQSFKNQNTIPVNTDMLSTGTYIVQVENSRENTAVFKVLK